MRSVVALVTLVAMVGGARTVGADGVQLHGYVGAGIGYLHRWSKSGNNGNEISEGSAMIDARWAAGLRKNAEDMDVTLAAVLDASPTGFSGVALGGELAVGWRANEDWRFDARAALQHGWSGPAAEGALVAVGLHARAGHVDLGVDALVVPEHEQFGDRASAWGVVPTVGVTGKPAAYGLAISAAAGIVVGAVLIALVASGGG